MFVREDGLPPHPEHFSDRFEVLCRKAGMPVIRLNECRHTAMSLALADGRPVKVVQEKCPDLHERVAGVRRDPLCNGAVVTHSVIRS